MAPQQLIAQHAAAATPVMLRGRGGAHRRGVRARHTGAGGALLLQHHQHQHHRHEAVCCAAAAQLPRASTRTRGVGLGSNSSCSSTLAGWAAAAGRRQQRQPGSSRQGSSGRPACVAAASEQHAPEQQQQQELSVAPEDRQHTHLVRLSLSDFALVAAGRVELRPGLTAISGSSGAGKSVLVEALGALLGAAPPSSDCVRPPASHAVLEGTWWLAPHHASAARSVLAAAGLPEHALPAADEAEPGTGGGAGGCWLHLRREISGAGSSSRSRVAVNGVGSSLRVLRSLADLLVDVNGQAASLALRNSHQQLLMLDRVAGTDGLRAQLATSLARLAELEASLARLDALGDDEERSALQRRVDIIAAAGLVPGEDVALRRRLAAMEARRGGLEAAGSLQDALTGGGAPGGGAGSLLDGLRVVVGQLRGLVTTEEQQRRLLLAERRQLRGAEDGASSSAAAGHGERLGDEGSADDDGGAPDADEDEDDDDDASDAEVAASAAALAALGAALEELAVVEEGLREAVAQVGEYAAALDYSPSQAAAASSRLDLITKLARRFKAQRGASGLLELGEAWGAQLEAYYASQGQAEAWRVEADALQETATSLALQLSAARQAAAGRLAAAVQAQLGDLAMGASQFAVQLRWTPVADPSQVPSALALAAPASAQPPAAPFLAPQGGEAAGTSGSVPAAALASEASEAAGEPAQQQQQLFAVRAAGGLDAVSFLLAAGPAEPLRPLSEVASGGEAARVMLALKAAAATAGAGGAPGAAGADAAAARGPPPLLVLDELDAGVGARLGAPIGRVLRRLVAGPAPAAAQVLVVSHTPQVAAAAARHIQVSKAVGPDGRATSGFRALADRQERLAELADMMGLLAAAGGSSGSGNGDQHLPQQTDRALQLAAQLLDEAQLDGSISDYTGGGENTSSDLLQRLSTAAAAAGAASGAGSQPQHTNGEAEA